MRYLLLALALLVNVASAQMTPNAAGTSSTGDVGSTTKPFHDLFLGNAQSGAGATSYGRFRLETGTNATSTYTFPAVSGESFPLLLSGNPGTTAFGTPTDAATNSAIVKRDGSAGFKAGAVELTKAGAAALTLKYDGSNYASFTVDSAGYLTIAPVKSTGSLVGGVALGDFSWFTNGSGSCAGTYTGKLHCGWTAAGIENTMFRSDGTSGTVGKNAALFASRSGDISAGSMHWTLGAVALNDKTGDGTGNTSYALYLETHKQYNAANDGISHGIEVSVVNKYKGTTYVTDPYNHDNGGMMEGVRIIAQRLGGSDATTYDARASSHALGILGEGETGGSIARFTKGLLFGHKAIVSGGDAVAFADTHRMSWFTTGTPAARALYLVNDLQGLNVVGTTMSGRPGQSGALPGLGISWHYDGAQEVDFWNLYYGTNTSFTFKQKTAANTHTTLATMATDGNFTVLGGIATAGPTGVASKLWRLGDQTTSTSCTLDTTKYVNISMDNGAVIKLAVCQ